MSYIEVKEIAKEVRKDLKAAFPTIKFSVRSDFNTLRIEYTDGPVDDEVEAIAMKYCGRSGYDPNYGDYTKNLPILFHGEERLSALVYVFVSRNFSQSFLEEVSVYVKATYSDAATDNVKVATYKGGNAYFDSNNWDALKFYREICQRCNSFSPVAEQEKAKREKESKEYEAWKIQDNIDKATARLEQELEEESTAKISPVITKIESFFVQGEFAKLNKNSSIAEYKEQCKIASYIEQCRIDEVIALTGEEYDNLSEMLLVDFDWLDGKGGSESTAQLRQVEEWWQYTEEEQELWRQHAYNKCLLVVAPNREPFLIDPQGYKYARYVAFLTDTSSVAHLLPKASNVVQFPTWRTIAATISEIIESERESAQEIANSTQQEVVISSYGDNQTATQLMAGRDLEVGSSYTYNKELMTVEIIVTPHLIEPVKLPFQYEVISQPVVYEAWKGI